MVKTGLGQTAVARRAGDHDGPYGDYMHEVVKTTMTYQDGPMARLACEASDVAETIRKALDARDRPKARYRVAASAPLMLTTRKLLPDVAFDAFLRTQFPSPDPATRA
jgi:hypothetical protein